MTASACLLRFTGLSVEITDSKHAKIRIFGGENKKEKED